MAYHIVSIVNRQQSPVVEVNPEYSGDNGVILSAKTYTPERPIPINEGTANNYQSALSFANLMFGVNPEAFWDNGSSAIMSITPTMSNPQQNYAGSAGDLTLTERRWDNGVFGSFGFTRGCQQVGLRSRSNESVTALFMLSS